MAKKILFVVGLLLTICTAFAQQTIRLSGKVLNSKNEPVGGATIKVEGLSRQAAADVEGRFTLQLETGKKYVITISGAGYATKTIDDVEVKAGDDNSITITLENKGNLQEVVVRTSVRKETTSALLGLQRNNTAVSSGVSADFIRRTPDKNTGEVLKRVSGASIQDNKFVIIRGLADRYNAALINNAQLPSSEPDKKAFSFDVIPSVLIDNIIINKTATPDLPAEFAGGLVQIQTKDVPTKDILSVGFSWGFNTNSVFKDFTSNKRNKTDWLGFDDGSRSLPDGFPATAQEYRALGGSNTGIAKQIELSKLFSNDGYAQNTTTALPTQSYNITWGKATRFKDGGLLGTVLSLQYRNSMLKYNVERKLHENDGDVLVQLNDEQNRYAVNAGALMNFTYVKGKHKISFKNLFNQLFEDNYYTRTGVSNDRIQDIDFRSSILNQRSLYSGQLEGLHQISKSGIKLGWNGNFSYNWKSQPDLRTAAYFRAKGSNDAFEFNDDDTRRFYSDLKDFSYGGSGFLSIPFTMGKQKQTFKAGGSTLIRIRNFNSRILRYEPANISQFDASKNTLPYDQIFAPENMAKDGFKVLDFTNNQDKYFGVSIINGVFGMFDNKLSEALRLVWGVRMENFQQFLTTKDVTAKRVVVNTDKWDFLPSLNLTVSPNTKSNFRIAASRTVARPEFREIAPFSFFDYEVNYAVNGNPDLKRTSILNGDIRYEFYPKGGEAISIGAFYKQFKDPIELRLNPSSVLDRRNYQYANADKAEAIGVEFEIRKNLDFISKSLEKFSIFSNITYIYSKVTLLSTTGSGSATSSNRPLQGQSPYLINAGLQYDNAVKGWSGSLLYNRVGQRLALVGINELGFPDVYERPRNQVDIQLAKKVMNKRGEFRLTWADVLNNAYYFYENTDSKKAFAGSTDRLFNAYKPGSTITLGFTYDFNISKK